MGVWAYPGRIDRASKLAALLAGPVSARDVDDGALKGLAESDDLYDRIDEAVRSDRHLDVSTVIAAALDGWLRELDTFVIPWEPEAVEIVRRAVDGVNARWEAAQAARAQGPSTQGLC